MADTSRLILDLESKEFEHGVHQRFWELVERAEWFVYVRLYAADDRTYIIELDCTNYGEEPIRGRFVAEKSRECRSDAWPHGNAAFGQWVKFKDPELFICWDQDRDGIRHHAEWRQRKAWAKQKNQLVAYLDFLRSLLHLEAKGYDRQVESFPT